MHTTHPPRDPAQLRAWIKFQLDLRGTNLQKLAEQHGLSRNAVRVALVRPYPRGERIIAAALGFKHPRTLWPGRYDEHGLPLRGGLHPAGGASATILVPGARRAQGARE